MLQRYLIEAKSIPGYFALRHSESFSLRSKVLFIDVNKLFCTAVDHGTSSMSNPKEPTKVTFATTHKNKKNKVKTEDDFSPIPKTNSCKFY